MQGSYPRFHALPEVHERYCRRRRSWRVSMWCVSKQTWLRVRAIPCLCVSSGVGVLSCAPLHCRRVPCASFIASSRGSDEAMVPFLAAAGGAYAVNFPGDIASDT